ncbi:MAG: YwpF family protein [Paenisporosarcina sp.]|nr:YwpF family protein [Paenisporosarcina sp.]
MKTFKMLSMTVVQGDQTIAIPLVDGIIINQENSHRSWILEMYVDKTDSTFFEQFKNSGELMEVKVIISYPENEPASFEVAVNAVKTIGDYVSVLFTGTLKRVRRKYAEQLLSELISNGISGEELIARFEKDMRNRPQLKKDSATV